MNSPTAEARTSGVTELPDGRAPGSGGSARGARVRCAGTYVLVVAGWLIAIAGNRWFVNPDGVVYAILAERLASGQWSEVVTTYWSPLFPAAATPLVAFGVPALAALRLVLLAAALVAVGTLRALCRHAGASPGAVDLAGLAAVPLVVLGSVFGVYPDLLMGCFLLLHLRALLTGESASAGVLAGVWAGAAYLTKSVALPFAAGLVLLVLVVRLLSRDGARSRVLARTALTVAAAAVVAGPWVGLISSAAGTPTISTAGGFNAQMVTPGAWGNPLSYPGLYPPADAAAETPWEDPDRLEVPGSSQARGESVTVADRLTNAYGQGRVAAGSLARRWLPVLAVTVVGAWVLLRRGTPLPRRRVGIGALVAGAAFVVGMALIVVVERYLWFPMLATLPAAAVGLTVLGRRIPRRWAAPAGVGWVLLVTVALLPPLLAHWGQDREVWRLADRIESRSPLSGPLAGNQDWERSQLLAYLSDVDYVGLTGPIASPQRAAGRLREVGAAHLVLWPTGDDRAGTVRVQDVGQVGLSPHGGQ